MGSTLQWVVLGAMNFLLSVMWQFHVSSPYGINLSHEGAIIHIYFLCHIFNFVALKEELHHKFYHLKHQVCNGS